jgi:hypothetical protein
MPKLAKQVQAIRASLRRFEGDLRRLVPVLATAMHASVGMPKAGGPRRKLRLSPERRRALKLQGRYLGFMRQLKPTQKAKVKAVKARKGIHAAIATARRMAGRGR